MQLFRFISRIPFIESMKGYHLGMLKNDLVAGLTVGLIAVPLSMALAINSGVSPQYGLYTAIVAGFLIALFGGSRYNISGPTAAFVIILQPISAQYGLTGLLTASFLAGLILLFMGLMHAGKMIFFVPQSVTTGFSMGIAVVIALTQLPDFLGAIPDIKVVDFITRIESIIEILDKVSIVDVSLGVSTLIGMMLFRRLFKSLPPHLFALAVSALIGCLFSYYGFEVRTIYSVFSYTVNGVEHSGIPPVLPSLSLPWTLPDGSSTLSFQMIQQLLPSAFAIAILGAIESLLCAVVADGMTNTRHNPDAELIGQGIGNIVAPFFGGFAATGALARTATSIRTGAKTPLAGVIHALFVLVTLVLFASLLNYLPMASLAALLFTVAWGMADIKAFKAIWLISPNQDRIVLFTCFALTVVFDMVVAVMVGMMLSCALFMARMMRITQMNFLSAPEVKEEGVQLDDPHVLHYKISGPFFFGVTNKAMSSLSRLSFIEDTWVAIIYLDEVPFIDLTGLMAFNSMVNNLLSKNIMVVFSGVTVGAQKPLLRAGLTPKKNDKIYWVANAAMAEVLAKELCAKIQTELDEKNQTKQSES